MFDMTAERKTMFDTLERLSNAHPELKYLKGAFARGTDGVDELSLVKALDRACALLADKDAGQEECRGALSRFASVSDQVLGDRLLYAELVYANDAQKMLFDDDRKIPASAFDCARKALSTPDSGAKK